MKFIATGDFYTDLAMRESSMNHMVINQFGFLGLYQFGEHALQELNFYTKKEGIVSNSYYQNNNWDGTWLGKYGVNSKEDFLNNIDVQEIIVREYHELIWTKKLNDYHKYVNKQINGINLTKNGMIAASHLVGSNSVKKFIDSEGRLIQKDRLNTSIIDYLQLFANTTGDYSTDINKFYQKLNIQKN